MDALDQSEVASTRLSEPNGPMRTELAAALEIIMAYPKVAAFGIADINPERDVEGQMVQSTLAVIKGGVRALPDLPGVVTASPILGQRDNASIAAILLQRSAFPTPRPEVHARSRRVHGLHLHF
jgi:hypothetical protein